MEMLLFSVKDNKAGIFKPPFAASTTVEACRSFKQACKDKTVQLSLFPEDFDLYQLGVFDDSTGLLYGKNITNVKYPLFIVSAVSFSKIKETNDNDK